MKQALIILFISCWVINIYSQNLKEGKLVGVVVDSTTEKPLPGVIVLAESAEKKILKIATSNEKGAFIFENSQTFSKLKFIIVGYAEYCLDSLAFKSGRTDVGVIKMKEKPVQLGEVLISEKKSIVEYFVDKQVVNIDKIPGINGSVAEALEKTGIVNVDPVTKEVSLRGSMGVNVLMDGKPLEEGSLSLTQVPSSLIEKVEIMTVPSAKYDAEGDAGVINLISKRNLGDYINGCVSLSASTQKRIRGDFFINYRKDKYNIFISAGKGFSKPECITKGSNQNYSQDDLYSEQYSSTDLITSKSGNLKAGIDYEFNEKNTASLSIEVRNSNSDINNQLNTIGRSSIEEYTYNQQGNKSSESKHYSVSGFYKTKFNDYGTELTSDIFFTDIDDGSARRLIIDKDFGQLPENHKNSTSLTNYTFIVNSDYVNPTKQFGKFEAGYKFTYRSRNNSYNVADYDTLSMVWVDTGGYSNTFKYKEGIAALYFTYTNKIWIFDYKFGLRAEQTFNQGIQKSNGSEFKNNYLDFFPTGNVSYSMGNGMQLIFSATRRISRPMMEFLNPFTVVNGFRYISQGNPYLKPMYINRYELGLNPFITGYYSYGYGKPATLPVVLPDGRFLSMVANLNKVKNIGADINLPLSNGQFSPITYPAWWLMGNISISYYRTTEIGSMNYDGLIETKNVSRDIWHFNTYAVFHTMWGCMLTVGLQYTPKNSDNRNIYYPSSSLYLSLSKYFFNRKLSISLTANNIMDSETNRYDTYSPNYLVTSESVMQRSRNISLYLRWTFNDFQFREERKVTDDRDESGK